MKNITKQFFLIIALFTSLYSNIIEVPSDQTTIQAAIDFAVDLDTIIVAEGIYQENINFYGKGVIVASKYILEGDGRYITETIIDGNREGSVVIFENGEDSTAQLIGFSVINGSGNYHCRNGEGCNYYGGGIFCLNSSPLLKNLIIRDNETNISGGGLFFENSNAVLINCTISDNYANTGDSDSYGIYAMGAHISLINTIVFPDDMRADFNNKAYYSLINNSPWFDSDWIGSDMISGSPQYVNPDSNNYHLSDASPGIDGGATFFSYLYEPNYNGGRINIGAYGNSSEATLSNPEIDLQSDSLFFQSGLNFEPDSIYFSIYNTGSTRLNLLSIDITEGPFSVYYDQINYLMPLDSLSLKIDFSPTELDTFYSVLEILSNDEDESIKRIILSGSSLYLRESPSIISIEDVPNDQGGWVKVNFKRSTFDTDSLVLSKMMSTELYTVEINDGSGWIAAVSTIAYGQDNYTILVPTTKDSTSDSNGLIEFRVIAGMEEGNYCSDILSGYSVDNLKPAVPTGLIAEVFFEEYLELSWHPNKETDLKYYQVLRSDDGTEFSIVSMTIDTLYIDDTIILDQTYYYAVQSVDHSGNLSGLSDQVNVTVSNISNDKAVPSKFNLLQNFPNPFNPITKINYQLPVTSDVELSIYNILGEKVSTLVLERQQAGKYLIEWDASGYSSGIYYYKINTSDFQDVRKMILLR